jgi:hypothetical protein
VGEGNPGKKGIPIVLRDGESGLTTSRPSMYKYITNIHIQDTLDDFCCHPLVMRLTLPKACFCLVPILYLNLNLVGHGYISIKHWHVPAIIPHSRIRFWSEVLQYLLRSPDSDLGTE